MTPALIPTVDTALRARFMAGELCWHCSGEFTHPSHRPVSCPSCWAKLGKLGRLQTPKATYDEVAVHYAKIESRTKRTHPKEHA